MTACESVSPSIATPLAAALLYASRGWPVIPLHTPQQGGCSCGGDCAKSIGKHPRTKGGLKDGTTDIAQIKDWWAKWPAANVGIVTGRASGLVVIDVDTRSGGEAAFARLTADHDSDPPTLTYRTGGGGRHYLYRYPAARTIKGGNNLLAQGVDVKSDGGYIVAPPSLHASGGVYALELDTKIAALPDWIIHLIDAKRTPPGRAPVSVLERAQRYVDKMPAAISGSGGHAATWAVAQVLVRGFSLTRADAMAVLKQYNARCQPPWSDRELEHKLDSADKNSKQPSGYLLTERIEVTHVDDGWEQSLDLDDKGQVVKSLPNLVTILSRHPSWRGVLGWDEFCGREVFMRPPPWPSDVAPAKSIAVRELRDEDDARIQCWLTREYKEWKVDKIRAAVSVVCQSHSVHPVRSYLSCLAWDGTDRIATYGERYMGAPADEHGRSAIKRWLISAVKRIMEPGCQADSILVIEGEQGTRKSSMLQALAGDQWFSDCLSSIDNKDAAQDLLGKWIVEIGELRWHNRDEEARKAFLSRRVDHYRPSYGRRAIDVPRQCVFAGTTNSSDWQTDSTGARRYWAVRANGMIALDAVRADRDHLWAQAMWLYSCGEPSWLQPDELPAHRAALDERRDIDPWEDRIREWLQGRETTTVTSVLDACINLPVEQRIRSHALRAASIMRSIGWRSTISSRDPRDGSRTRLWVRQES